MEAYNSHIIYSSLLTRGAEDYRYVGLFCFPKTNKQLVPPTSDFFSDITSQERLLVVIELLHKLNGSPLVTIRPPKRWASEGSAIASWQQDMRGSSIQPATLKNLNAQRQGTMQQWVQPSHLPEAGPSKWVMYYKKGCGQVPAVEAALRSRPPLQSQIENRVTTLLNIQRNRRLTDLVDYHSYQVRLQYHSSHELFRGKQLIKDNCQRSVGLSSAIGCIAEGLGLRTQ